MQIITGGLGFIGNELVRQLAAAGEEVAILDNRSRVAPRIDDLKSVAVYEIDITDHDAVARITKDLAPRVVYHLAAIHYIPECNANPEKTIRVNVEGTLGLLRACSAAASVEHFVFASSGAVYADSPQALTETASVEPVDIYGWSKLFAEQLCQWHHAREGLPVTLCRLFNNYGPRETNAHIIPEIISQLRLGDRLTLGNVSPIRDYVHTSRTAEALAALGKLRPAEPLAINVASGKGTSVAELIGIMGEILGRELTIVKDPARFRAADKQVQVADVSLLEKIVPLKAAIDIRDGLRNLLEFEGLLTA